MFSVNDPIVFLDPRASLSPQGARELKNHVKTVFMSSNNFESRIYEFLKPIFYEYNKTCFGPIPNSFLFSTAQIETNS